MVRSQLCTCKRFQVNDASKFMQVMIWLLKDLDFGWKYYFWSLKQILKWLGICTFIFKQTHLLSFRCWLHFLVSLEMFCRLSFSPHRFDRFTNKIVFIKKSTNIKNISRRFTKHSITSFWSSTCLTWWVVHTHSFAMVYHVLPCFAMFCHVEFVWEKGSSFVCMLSAVLPVEMRFA